MYQDEFVKLHGQEAWDKLVRPKKEAGTNEVESNANVLAHLEIIPILSLLGFQGESLLEAKKELESLRTKVCL